MIPAEICRAALCEAGRPDLARNIGTNRRGQPIRAWTAYSGKPPTTGTPTTSLR